MHGLARLTGAPRFWLFFLGPGIIFTLDKVKQTLHRSLNELIVLNDNFSDCEFENTSHTTGRHRNGIATFGRN